MTPHDLINPSDTLEQQNDKLKKIANALMRRVEQGSDGLGAAYTQFQRAVMLEEEVQERTRDLGRALELLNTSNAQLAEANRETEAARRNLTNAIETVQEGFALFNADEVLVMCNSRFGMHMPDIRDRMQPGLSFHDYVDLVSQSQFLALAQGETSESWAARRMERHQDRHVIFNARMVWNRWVQVSEHRTPDGGTVILQTDVTDIMRLERRERDRMLDTQAKLIRATLEHLEQGVCIFDDKARLVGWNQRAGELLSLPVGRLRMGSEFGSLFDRFRSDVRFDRGMSVEGIADWVTQQGPRRPLSFEMEHMNGRILTVSAQEMPDRGFVISFSDVSAERAAVQAVYEANEQLEQRVNERTLELGDALAEAERANASKSRFVAAASHDLLQPLSAAKLYVGSVIADQPEGQSKSVLERASNALDSVEHILGALLDISKLDSGQAATHIGHVHLGRMLAQICDELAPTAAAKGISLRVVPTTAVVTSDASYLRRILQNLIGNAVRYTETGKVLVGVRRHGARLRVEVHDTGPGIAPDQQELIFKEFHRVEAPSSASEGLGLGLAIVDRACAVLSHPLRLTSALGQGTTFAVDLPVTQRPVNQRPVNQRPATPSSRPRNRPRNNATWPADATDPPSGLDNMIVLLLENDADLRAALALTMSQWGVTVLPAQTEDECWQQVAEFDVVPDAIVADYQLDNGVTGPDVVASLRQSLAPLPGCLITATRGDGARHAAEALDLPVLTKPLSDRALYTFLMDTYQQAQGH